MSERENPTGPLTRQDGENLKVQDDIEEHKTLPTSGIKERAIRTEGDGRSPEPVIEDSYIEKTNNQIVKEETLHLNSNTVKDSKEINSNSKDIMSRTPNDDREDAKESYSTDAYEEKERKTDAIPTKAKEDLLNSKYAEDNEVDYNDFYEKLPPQEEEEENYLPEEFRVPSSLSSASSTVSEISEKKPARRRRNYKESEDEAAQNEAPLDNTEDGIRDNGENEEKIGGEMERQDEGDSADRDEDFSSSPLITESEEEESEEEEETTEEEEEEEEKMEEEEEDDGYKSSSVASISSVPTYYSGQEEEAEDTAVSRPTTADLAELPKAAGT